MFKSIEDKIRGLAQLAPSPERLIPLNQLVEYLQTKIHKGEKAQLNFICTHNSRRSQMAQVWTKLLADFYGVELETFSGGTEVTAFHPNALAVFEKMGLEIQKEGSNNPHYFLRYSETESPIEAFSKLYDDASNPSTNFAAIMTCSSADANCPFIPSAERRVSLTYEDPKKFDDSEIAQEAYEACALRIAQEMNYVFKSLKK
ncbi:MAG: protein-tyrosine-phosphatase [Flavobacteriales bacterium]|nr:protein-tyrosine-phosphatase [Flavobacteriales bacterium]|tara:strand:+ start:15041 stop:15646 length:606 start_codon:yes stop_codon:yes gene_type:complete